MSRRPKPINLGSKVSVEDAAPSVEASGARKPKPLTLPDSAPQAMPATSTTARAPRPIHVQSPPVTQRTPRELSMSPQDRAKGEKVAKMLERAYAIDPSMEQFKFRLKGRFEEFLITPGDDLINWGERNLTALRDVTKAKVLVAKQISDMDATGWIARTQEAASKELGFFDRFKRQEPPSFYTDRLSKIRADLVKFLPELSKLRDDIFPDAEDLRMDIMALQVYTEWLDDNVHIIMAQNRVQTLVASQQTVLMVLAAIDNAKTLCATNVQTIDELLTITIPNWDIARSTK